MKSIKFGFSYNKFPIINLEKQKFSFSLLFPTFIHLDEGQVNENNNRNIREKVSQVNKNNNRNIREKVS